MYTIDRSEMSTLICAHSYTVCMCFEWKYAWAFKCVSLVVEWIETNRRKKRATSKGARKMANYVCSGTKKNATERKTIVQKAHAMQYATRKSKMDKYVVECGCVCLFSVTLKNVSRKPVENHSWKSFLLFFEVNVQRQTESNITTEQKYMSSKLQKSNQMIRRSAQTERVFSFSIGFENCLYYSMLCPFLRVCVCTICLNRSIIAKLFHLNIISYWIFSMAQSIFQPF